MPPHPHTSIPKHSHHNITPHPYPSMPPHPIFLCPYRTSTPMYVPYVVPHYPNIPSLGYLHRPPSRLSSSILHHIFPPEARARSSKIMSENRRKMRNRRSPEQIMKSRDAIIIREG